MTTAATGTTATGRPRRQRDDLRLVAHQVGYEQLSFWRNPQSAIFTFIFPVLFVAIMGALFGSVGKSSYFGGLSALQYYVPTIGALSVLGSCYGQLAVALAARRQAGILKRIRATPLPAWAYFTGLLAHCVLVSVIDIALIVAVGRLYGVPGIPTTYFLNSQHQIIKTNLGWLSIHKLQRAKTIMEAVPSTPPP